MAVLELLSGAAVAGVAEPLSAGAGLGGCALAPALILGRPVLSASRLIEPAADTSDDGPMPPPAMAWLFPTSSVAWVWVKFRATEAPISF